MPFQYALFNSDVVRLDIIIALVDVFTPKDVPPELLVDANETAPTLDIDITLSYPGSDSSNCNNLLLLLSNPDEMYQILNVSKFNFDRAVKTHIFKNYSESEMIIEIDKYTTNKELKKEEAFEVTIVRTNEEGNFILPEDNEIKKIKE